jgi:hypothetical protein
VPQNITPDNNIVAITTHVITDRTYTMNKRKERENCVVPTSKGLCEDISPKEHRHEIEVKVNKIEGRKRKQTTGWNTDIAAADWSSGGSWE